MKLKQTVEEDKRKEKTKNKKGRLKVCLIAFVMLLTYNVIMSSNFSFSFNGKEAQEENEDRIERFLSKFVNYVSIFKPLTPWR